MAKKNYFPKISFVIPTLNEESRIAACLDSIVTQNYPSEKVEILIADGGSTDATVNIAKRYGARVLDNPLKTSESGKAVGIKNATGEIFCQIDGDNLLTDKNWIKKMVAPLINDKTLIGTEALHFTWRPKDGYIDRYCALIGMNDPLCLWLGSYDRMNQLTQKWTGLPVKYEWKNGYIEVLLEPGKIPTIGANGFMIRLSEFREHADLVRDYLFDVDILEHLTRIEGPKKFAKVDVGVVHLYSGSSVRRFAKKQLRRVKDYLYRRSAWDVFVTNEYNDRKYTYGQDSSKDLIIKIIRFAVETVLVFPLLFQSIKGYRRVKDIAWFAHPLLCWVTLLTYAYGTLDSFFHPTELSRENW